MNVKELRRLLESWGFYWHEQRKGSGYASTSTTEQCLKILRTGVYSQGTNRMSNLDFDVPIWVQEIDDEINTLSEQQKKDVKKRYINNDKSVKTQALYQAEIYLSGVL